MKASVCVLALGLIAGGSGWWLGAAAPAQPAAAPAPAKYQVALRYRILAPRDQHALLYDRLIDHLQRLNFEFVPPLDERPDTDRIDPNKNELRGLIPSANVGKLRDNPNVAAILLLPEKFEVAKLPADQPVRVRIELVSGLPPDRQRELAEQSRLLLGLLGFKEATAYDHRGVQGAPYTKVIGSVPAGQIEVLLKDLRRQPGGWFAPRIAGEDLPSPLRDIDPIVYTEVLSDPEPIADAAAPAPRSPEYLDKIGAGLWEIVNDKEKETTLVRVQVLFAGQPSPQALRQIGERAAPSAFVEGILGPYVTATLLAQDVKTLAALPEVLAVRLPPPAPHDVDPNLPAAKELEPALAASGLADLHRSGKRGQGIRVAILDADFRGWQDQVKSGKLPKTTRLVDLTAERSGQLLPAAELPGADLGHGTQCALAAAVAAPAADFVLIRVGGDDPYEIAEVAEHFRGIMTTPTLERRLDELRVAVSVLALQRARLQAERKIIFNNFADEEEERGNFGFLGPVYGWIFSEREWHRQGMAYQEKQEQELEIRERRYWKLVEQIQSLKDMPIVVSSPGWNDRYPLGGASPLSRALDGQPKGPLWFQAAGNTAGQAWIGTYRDFDKNGIMEFAAADAKLPPGRWTSELNFLAWQPYAGKPSLELPGKTALRISLQWREPHDPDYFLSSSKGSAANPADSADAVDPYRRPVAELKLVLVRQRDPEGKTVGADAFEVVARSPALPWRLDHQPEGTVYEHLLEFTVDKPGRYAVRIERQRGSEWALNKTEDRFSFELRQGLTSTGIRAVFAPTLPALEKQWELQPRLFVEVADDAHRRQGRPQLADFSTAAGGIGMPADARSVIAVGAADLKGRAQPYSAAGPPPFVDLATKPNIFAFDAVRQGKGGALGTSLSASFAAGAAATLLSTGMTVEQMRELLRQQKGELFRAPR